VINVICHYRGNIVGGKRIMKLMGFDLGPNRVPFQNMTDEEEARMNEEAKEQHREDVKDYDLLVAEYDRLLPFMNVVEIKAKKEEELVLDGSAEHSLFAATWTLLHTASYQEAVEKAVELSGGKNLPILVSTLAAAHYGFTAIPKDWLENLSGREEAYELAMEWQQRWLN